MGILTRPLSHCRVRYMTTPDKRKGPSTKTAGACSNITEECRANRSEHGICGSCAADAQSDLHTRWCLVELMCLGLGLTRGA